MIAKTLKWIGGVDGYLEIIDQRLLPAEFVKLQCRDIEKLYEAIKTLAVRGAPAIGVAGAYGLVLGLQKPLTIETKNSTQGSDLTQGLACLAESREYLASSRPTAVNLFWALDRGYQSAQRFAADEPTQSPED